ncbi:aldo/keto reductase [Devosia sp.]|uniref:aldo/keto reductase n=1 Tax=Devosia sp. TaxID=1871048 RepID=UPI0025EF4ECB|nr:aldo/keto reductase [Devosia sp.]MCR6633751.1 aldo/keto reductase [Devosia sp.]
MPGIDVPKRRLGKNGPLVPAFALGSWNTWNRMSPDDAVTMVQRAVEVGAAFFDVAYYNMGPHEEHSRTDILFGAAIRAAGVARRDFQVCGKLWLWEYPKLNFRQQIETSLERAGLDRFDTLVVGDYFGTPDMEPVVAGVNELIAAGLVDGWGINNWHFVHTRQALDFADKAGLVGPSFAQLKYSVVRRSMAEGAEYGALFADGTLGLQASDCLEGGILAGRGVPARKIGADVGAIRERIYAAAPKLKDIADEFEASPVQLALAFCLANPNVTNVLFGASRLEQLEDNLGAIALLNRAGDRIRPALADLWLDQHVRSDGVW